METTIDAIDEAQERQIEAAQRLLWIAQSEGDISAQLDEGTLTELGSRVVEDYNKDLADRDDWERVAKDAMKKAAQCNRDGEKTFPWHNASNVNYPLLTVGALQFNARAYPAIVKGDEAANVKVVGNDNGVPELGPNGQPVLVISGMPVIGTPQGPMVMGPMGPTPAPEGVEPEVAWRVPPGGKAARAQRVKDYLNAHLFYRIDGWEADTDLLLMQLPIVGCAFRKIYYDAMERKHCVKLVSALNLVAPMAARDCKTAVRLTEVLPEQYPLEILEKVRSGYYRPAEFLEGEDFTQKPRQLIEQHCRFDIDRDGYPEPYVVTVDVESGEVLRVVANFEWRDVRAANGKVAKIAPRQYYVKYGFFPHPEGKFYDLGLGHLLEQIGDVIDTIINQMLDAGTAAVAGGGFIGAGVRLQGRNRSSTIRMAPGEWKPVNVDGNKLREAMVERTLPQPSNVMFQMLELMLGAAQDISSVKDVLTGEAKNTGQVGTTLALIEQGLQMFTAIYKRVYRGLKAEYELLFQNIAAFADEQTAQDYKELLDDPQANLMQDFAAANMDIRPVSDPQTVTKMQKMARAQFLGGFLDAPGVNPQEIIKRMWEAADVDDIEELLLPPQEPDPMQVAGVQVEIEGKAAKAVKDRAAARRDDAEAEAKRAETALKALAEGFRMAA